MQQKNKRDQTGQSNHKIQTPEILSRGLLDGDFKRFGKMLGNRRSLFFGIAFLTSQFFLPVPLLASSPEAQPNEVREGVVGAISNWPAKSDLQIELQAEKYTLKNGLTVILHQDKSLPMISYHTWYRVGSRDEKPGVTGAAHMLEHMMFKGAKKYSGKEFDRILHENGITNNAFTSFDYTGFYQNLPSSKLELMMEMEVDRMRFLSLKPEDLKSELQVVGEERRWRVDNNPMGLLREQMMASLYRQHPYRWPVIGHMEDIQAYTVEKLKPFYDNYYVPNNAVLVLAGDFEIAEAKKLIEKHYGVLPKKDIPARTYPQENLGGLNKRTSLKWSVAAPSLMIGYRGLPAGHEDSYALDLAANVLGSGSSSRLYRRLLFQDQAATQVYAYNMTNDDPGAFFIYAAVKPGKNLKSIETAIQTEVEALKKTPLSDEELDKVKTQVMNEYIQSLTTIDGKAQSLAVNEILFGDYKRFQEDLKRYQSVTADQIQKAAKKYLVSENKVVSTLLPKK